MKGFDTPTPVTRFTDSFKSKGYDFIARYYNVNNDAKNLTLAEAKVITASGLSIIAVWENGYPTSAPYFNHPKGVYDGTAAYHYAQQEIDQPADSAIYFAVDFDASTKDIEGGIADYFKGVQDAFNTISNNAPVYKIGVYGSGLTCSLLQKAGLVSFCWLAQSMGWGESKTYTGYNIKQQMQITECKEIAGGITGDPDESPDENIGAFTV